MAYITMEQQFCADDYQGLVIGLAADLIEHDSGYHTHNKDQLLFSHHGCMIISLDGLKCVLPPMRAAWIPAGIEHKAQTSNVTHYRSLYFDQCLQSQLPRELKIFDINPLMSALMERMALWTFDKPDKEQVNSVNLLIEELNLAEDSHLNLPIPTDTRLTSWLAGIDDEQFIAPTLAELSLQVGASAKTITRIFNKEVGMPYQSWRQQWRLLAAIELLSKSWRVSDVAHHLAFSSDSAFISFFREKTGYTPVNFMREQKD
ncbi:MULTISPECIES: helix-turn-helix transcriptional regulator [unclassified Photobacterium]|uniref:AraC family transcriptional regulator n=1 Tax=unclassified Photobacterium TaxID=2628852 RepID=UPI001EDE7846|nr:MULTISPECIES: helix-turn-helix transcriptional regulator [unclassified Photobacterium]MCG3863245.1 helix-turn-helix transcriptional regulator [Photobacterium sp. Ph6]MCG3874775.1 helix-turn-helix transcriptional regulator [Photobacterium sp. Ph5]